MLRERALKVVLGLVGLFFSAAIYPAMRQGLFEDAKALYFKAVILGIPAKR